MFTWWANELFEPTDIVGDDDRAAVFGTFRSHALDKVVNQLGQNMRNVEVIRQINGLPRDRIDEAGVENSSGTTPPIVPFGREEGAEFHASIPPPTQAYRAASLLWWRPLLTPSTPRMNPQVMRRTEAERDVTKPQIRPRFTWSEQGFESP